uniref:uncharacterized protein LOC122588332 n=1 Tax=Erigeron canadensis TaxID=72917 RepID=UPI001CB8D51D|nr:uncharacterized protein LOC122588332 [Erigeron canadensis]
MKYPTHLGTYNGKDDPDDFLQKFKGRAEMQNWVEPVACKAFRLGLTSDAREWLGSLTEGSINNFDELKTKFLSHFCQQKKHKKTHVAAHNIKQREHETSRDFIERFTVESQEITCLVDSQRVSGLIHGCRNRELVECLNTDLAETFDEAKKKAHKFLDTKEIGASNLDDTRYKKGKWQSNKDQQRYSPYNREEKRRDYNISLPEMTKTPKEILLTEAVGKTFPTPSRLSEKGRRDKDKYCDFHNDTGHDTNSCMQLKKAIDEVIKTGKLAHLEKGIRQQGKPKADESGEQKYNNTQTTIYTIRRERQVEKRKGVDALIQSVGEISFPPILGTNVSNDPIIIKAILQERWVDKIHIDDGSDCNILYEHAFLRDNPLLRILLSPPGTRLISFSGDKTEPAGKVTLAVTIVAGPCRRIEELTFMLIKGHSPYNAIPGRQALQKFGMIPSVIHNMIKFQTEDGIANLRGSFEPPRVHGQTGTSMPTKKQRLGREEGELANTFHKMEIKKQEDPELDNSTHKAE